MRSGRPILLTAAVLSMLTSCFDFEVCRDPSLDHLMPGFGHQGTDIQVIATGSNLDCNGDHNHPPSIITDGDGLTADPPLSQSDSDIVFIMHVAPNARRGSHRVTVQTASVSDPVGFEVSCATCGPPPTLWTALPNSELTQGGTAEVEFDGQNFLGAQNLQVHTVGPGISISPGPPTIYTDGFAKEYFYLDLTADANATTGAHDVYITTDGGQSETRQIYVEAPPPPPPPPGPAPFLSRIFSGDVLNPSHITKSASQVSVKFEGTSFGTNSELIMDPNPNNVIQSLGEVSGATSPATDITGLVSFYASPGSESSVTVRVHNRNNNTMSNPLVLLLDPPKPGAPVINFAYFLVNGFAVTEIHPNSEADLHINGQNFSGVTNRSFSGIPGLKFSNVVYNFADDFLVHVQADASTPVSGNEATNLTITTSNGPVTFWVQILP